MNYNYRIILTNEELTVGPVRKTERTDCDYTFLDEQDNIVAMFKRDLVQGIVRTALHVANTEIKNTETKMVEAETAETKKPMPEPTPMPLSHEKPLRPPANPNAPIETGVRRAEPIGTYQLRKNQGTKGYEVHMPARTIAELQSAEREIAAATMTPTTKQQIVRMEYKGVITTGIYDPDTKKVTIPAGARIAKKESNSLRKAKNYDGVRAKRRAILRNMAEPHDEEYCVLTTEVEFSSLSQACCALSGTILNTSQYWKFINK